MHEHLIKCGLVSGCRGCAASHTQALCRSWSTSVKPRDLRQCFFSLCKCVDEGQFLLAPGNERWMRHLELNFTFCMHSLQRCCCAEFGQSPNWDLVLAVLNGGVMSTTRTGVATSVCTSFEAWSTLREIKREILSLELKVWMNPGFLNAQQKALFIVKENSFFLF